MSKENKMDRRNLLKMASIGAAGALGTSTIAKALCSTATPPQTEGPFYPVNEQDDLDWDLTRVTGKAETAKGTVVIITGTVTDQNCQPVVGALVEIWQACETGRYNHPSDPNTGVDLDPNFQYWSEQATDENGQFLFKTIIPGAYPASPTWTRPPHIHYKVAKRGYRELTTQMYFKGDQHNNADLILRSLTQAERDNVIVDFQLGETDLYPTGHFNVVLEEIR